MTNSVDAVQRICVGVIIAAHGVRGDVKIRIFTDKPKDIANFDEISDESGKIYKLAVISVPNNADFIIARIEGIESRNDAESMRHIKLYINRSALPIIHTPDEFYHADLCGMTARLMDGRVIGIIQNVVNYGATDILEICEINSEKIILYPFTKQCVLEVNVKERYVVVNSIDDVENAESI